MAKHILRRLIICVLIAILLCAGVVWIRRPDRHGKNPGIGGGDFGGCLIVGNLALNGEDIYRDSPPGVNTWPPLYSLFCTVPALLARPTPYLARGSWIFLNYVLVWLVLRMTVRLVYGRGLSLWPESTTLSFVDVEVVVPFLLCARFIISNLDHLQVNVLIFALVLGTLVLHAANRDFLSGCCLALASTLKIMPVLFLPYFLFRRRYRVAAVATAVGAVLFLSPSLVYGWSRFLAYLSEWLHVVGAGWGVGKMNQSMFAMLDRYLGHWAAVWNAKPTDALTVSGSRLPALAWLVVVGIVVAASARRFHGEERANSPASLLEYSVVLAASDIFGPVTWKAYFVNLLLPCTLLIALIRSDALPRSTRRVILVSLVFYAMLAAIPLADVSRFGQRMEVLSAPTLGVLAILFLLLWLRPRVAGCAPVVVRRDGRLPPLVAPPPSCEEFSP